MTAEVTARKNSPSHRPVQLSCSEILSDIQWFIRSNKENFGDAHGNKIEWEVNASPKGICLLLSFADLRVRGKGTGGRGTFVHNAESIYLSLCLPCPHIHFYTISSKSLHNPNRCLIFAAREPAKPLNDAQMCGSFFICTYGKQDNIQ